MKNNWIIVILFITTSCQTPGKENQKINRDSNIDMKDIIQKIDETHSYIIKNTMDAPIETLIENEEKTHYSKRIEKEKIKLTDPEIGIEKITDSILNHYHSEFNKNLEYYKDENLDLLIERPAELNLTSSYSIIHDSIISFKIEVAENFPLGTMYPYHKTIPVNYSIANNKVLTNKEILIIDNAFKSLIKERFMDPLSETQTNDSVTIDNIAVKGDFKILLTNKELIIYYYEFGIEEESYYSFTYDEILTNLQPTIKNLIKIE